MDETWDLDLEKQTRSDSARQAAWSGCSGMAQATRKLESIPIILGFAVKEVIQHVRTASPRTKDGTHGDGLRWRA